MHANLLKRYQHMINQFGLLNPKAWIKQYSNKHVHKHTHIEDPHTFLAITRCFHGEAWLRHNSVIVL